MKRFKRAFLLLLALIMVFASACTAEGGRESGDVSSAAESENAQSAATDSSDEQSENTVPEGFDDGIAYGVHELGNSLCGNVLYTSTYEVFGEAGDLYKYGEKHSALHLYRTDDSVLIKTMQGYLDECSIYDDAREYYDYFPEGKTEEVLPLADFAAIYGGRFFYGNTMVNGTKPQTVNYDFNEAKEKNEPIYFFLETAPMDDGVIGGIMAEYGVDRERAVAIYRQALIDTLSEHGFYADGFFDWYSFDTYTAYRFDHTQHDSFINHEANPIKFTDKYKYEDSVYNECAHLIFSVYAKGADIEALEAMLKSDDNKLFKARALPITDCYAFDWGKEAYVPEDTASFPFRYYNKAYMYFTHLAYMSFLTTYK